MTVPEPSSTVIYSASIFILKVVLFQFLKLVTKTVIHLSLWYFWIKYGVNNPCRSLNDCWSSSATTIKLTKKNLIKKCRHASYIDISCVVMFLYVYPRKNSCYLSNNYWGSNLTNKQINMQWLV